MRYAWFSIICLALAACGPTSEQVSASQTNIAMTVIADITAQAPKSTNTPIPTNTQPHTLTPIITLTSTSTKTPTPSKTPTLTYTPGPSSTPTNTSTPDPITFGYGELCDYLGKMTDIEQRAWVQQNKGKDIGPWRGRVANYFAGDSVVFYVDDNDDYNVIFTDPTKEYLINQVYDFYGVLFSISGGNFCLSIVLADEREVMNTLIEP